MITLHHLEYSQSFRILWLLEELGADYALETYERESATLLAPAAYKARSPTGAAPFITDGELVLAETSAIVDYLLDKYPNDALRPLPSGENRARHLFWSHTAQGSMTPILMMDSVFRIICARVPFFLRPLIGAIFKRVNEGFVLPRLAALLDRAEADLGSAPWFGGDALSAADILLSYPMECASMRGYLTDSYPGCRGWLERIYAYPSFVVAKRKDGKPSMVLPL